MLNLLSAEAVIGSTQHRVDKSPRTKITRMHSEPRKGLGATTVPFSFARLFGNDLAQSTCFVLAITAAAWPAAYELASDTKRSR